MDNLAVTKFSNLLEPIVFGHLAHDKNRKNRDLSRVSHIVGWLRLASSIGFRSCDIILAPQHTSVFR